MGWSWSRRRRHTRESARGGAPRPGRRCRAPRQGITAAAAVAARAAAAQAARAEARGRPVAALLIGKAFGQTTWRRAGGKVALAGSRRVSLLDGPVSRPLAAGRRLAHDGQASARLSAAWTRLPRRALVLFVVHGADRFSGVAEVVADRAPVPLGFRWSQVRRQRPCRPPRASL